MASTSEIDAPFAPAGFLWGAKGDPFVLLAQGAGATTAGKASENRSAVRSAGKSESVVERITATPTLFGDPWPVLRDVWSMEMVAHRSLRSLKPEHAIEPPRELRRTARAGRRPRPPALAPRPSPPGGL